MAGADQAGGAPGTRTPPPETTAIGLEPLIAAGRARARGDGVSARTGWQLPARGVPGGRSGRTPRPVPGIAGTAARSGATPNPTANRRHHMTALLHADRSVPAGMP